MYCNYQQDNWLDLLPLAKFAYNNTPSTTTGVSQLFTNKGYHLNITVHPERDLSSALAREYAVDVESLHQYLHEEMAAAQKRYQGPTDAKRPPAPNFKVGNQVYVKANVQIIHKGALLCPVSETKIRGMLQNTDLVPSVRD